jgi:ElaB/YqjD/DUF883 family membrane-anchored ribosome-binding protein
MDKKSVEKILTKIDEKVDHIQEPISQVVDTINNLLNNRKETESDDLIEFKIQLQEILNDFCEKMVDENDGLIEEFKSIEKIINKK